MAQPMEGTLWLIRPGGKFSYFHYRSTIDWIGWHVLSPLSGYTYSSEVCPVLSRLGTKFLEGRTYMVAGQVLLSPSSQARNQGQGQTGTNWYSSNSSSGQGFKWVC